jgi:hypothetical protein
MACKRQAASLKLSSDVLLPGIKINTEANDFFPIEQMQLMSSTGRHGSVRRHHRRGRTLDFFSPR